MERLRQYAALLLIAGVVGFAFQGSHGLLESTEGRYAEAAREMLETGNWLVPQLDYHPHWTKPPITYWAIAGGMAIFGENEWGIRLYNAIAFVVLVWVIGRIGERLWDWRTGVLGALLYATAPYPAYAASSVQTDVLLSLWEACVVLAYWEARNSTTQRREAAWVAALWIFCGLAFMTKGPPGLLTPAAVFVFELYMRRTGQAKVRLLRLAAIGAFLAIGGAWFLVVIWQTPGLLKYFVGEEVIGRVFSAHFDRNPHWYAPLYIYLPPLLFGLGPISAVWFVAVKRNVRALRWQVTRDFLRRHEHGVFLLMWLALPLTVLSFSQSRLPLYILPVFPALALATARLLTTAFARDDLDRRVWISALAMALVLVAAKGVMRYVPTAADMRPLYRVTQEVAGKDTAYYCYETTRLYGLQYYLHGQLGRLWKKPTEGLSGQGINTVFEEIKEHPKHDTYVLVTTTKKDSDDVDSQLRDNGIDAQQRTFRKKFNLFTIHPKPL